MSSDRPGCLADSQSAVNADAAFHCTRPQGITREGRPPHLRHRNKSHLESKLGTSHNNPIKGLEPKTIALQCGPSKWLLSNSVSNIYSFWFETMFSPLTCFLRGFNVPNSSISFVIPSILYSIHSKLQSYNQSPNRMESRILQKSWYYVISFTFPSLLGPLNSIILW